MVSSMTSQLAPSMVILLSIYIFGHVAVKSLQSLDGSSSFLTWDGLTVVNPKKPMMMTVCEDNKFKLKRMQRLWKKGANFNLDILFLVQFPFQGICKDMRLLGGYLNSDPINMYRDRKLICFDQFSLQIDPCLVYVVGIGQDLSFETALAESGCHVVAFGANEATKSSKNLIIKDITNGTLIEDGHQLISYLRVDVPGQEVALISEWLDRGIMDRVEQLSVEYHDVKRKESNQLSMMVQRLVQEGGFKFSGFDPNWAVKTNHSIVQSGELLFQKRSALRCDFEFTDQLIA